MADFTGPSAEGLWGHPPHVPGGHPFSPPQVSHDARVTSLINHITCAACVLGHPDWSHIRFHLSRNACGPHLYLILIDTDFLQNFNFTLKDPYVIKNQEPLPKGDIIVPPSLSIPGTRL